MPLTRRKLLAATPAGVLASAAFVAAPLVSQADPPQAAEKAIAPRTRRLRIAHLTDIHVQPERAASSSNPVVGRADPYRLSNNSTGDDSHRAHRLAAASAAHAPQANTTVSGNDQSAAGTDSLRAP